MIDKAILTMREWEGVAGLYDIYQPMANKLVEEEEYRQRQISAAQWKSDPKLIESSDIKQQIEELAALKPVERPRGR